jgi:hypothetical protein
MAHLVPCVLVSVLEGEGEQANRSQLNGAPPELALHLRIPSKLPSAPFPIGCQHRGVVHHLSSTRYRGESSPQHMQQIHVQ